MRALDRKLFRDLHLMRLQAAAIALVVASGVALFLATFTAYRALRISQERFYREQRFAGVWATLARAPRAVARELGAVPGVAVVDARIVESAVLDVPGLAEPASGLLVGIPPGPGHAVNDLYLRRGRHPEPGRSGEVVINEGFADANRLGPGARLPAVVAGRRVSLEVVGVALSPEHVMPVSPSGLQDDRRFVVAWMERDQLGALVGEREAFGDVALRLVPGADERAVVAAVDRILAPYGGRGAHGRAGQASHRMLEEHLRPLESLAMVVPTILLLVAAFLVHIVLSRSIAAQREQIGILKAFGYSSIRIAVHYLELPLVIVGGGIAIALPLGAWLGHLIARFFGGFFRFPVLVFRLEPDVGLAAAGIALVAAVAGAAGAVRRVLAMPPVVAMSPEVPAFGRGVLARLGMSRVLPPTGRIIVRNLARRPVRTVLAAGGMSLAVAVVVLGSGSADALFRMKTVWYQRAQRQDLTLQLANPRSISTARDFLHLPGVLRVEPFRALPARVSRAGQDHDLTLVGLPADGVLRRVVDSAGQESRPVSEGVHLTRWLANELGLRNGERFMLQIRDGRQRTLTVRLAGTVDEPLFLHAYAELRALDRWLGEPETYSGVHLVVDPLRNAALYEQLKALPVAASVDLRRAALANYAAMSDPAVEFIRRIELVFAVVIAFGVVFNTARVVVAERGRELATLRLLGFGRDEVARILLGELATLALPAIPLGFGLGWVLTSFVARAMSGERMHVPIMISSASYALAAAVFMAAAIASALVVRRGLDRLDLMDALKARE